MKKKHNNHSDIEGLNKFFDENYTRKTSAVTDFHNIDKIYSWTNEDMKLYPKEKLDGKKVLTITASADHALEAVLCGAKEIDSIDINVFCKYYSALKIAMIKKYGHDEFFDKINLFTNSMMNGYKSMIKYEILNDISKFLTEPEILFWKRYIQKNFFNQPELFLDGYSSYNRYYDKDLYLKLQDNLKEVNINYYDGDIANIDKILGKKTYDYIYLSNVIERIDPIMQDKWKVRTETIEKIVKHLNKNGSIYNYFLGLDSSGVINSIKNKFGTKTSYLNSLFDFEYYCDRDIRTSDCGVIRMTLK